MQEDTKVTETQNVCQLTACPSQWQPNASTNDRNVAGMATVDGHDGTSLNGPSDAVKFVDQVRMDGSSTSDDLRHPRDQPPPPQQSADVGSSLNLAELPLTNVEDVLPYPKRVALTKSHKKVEQDRREREVWDQQKVSHKSHSSSNTNLSPNKNYSSHKYYNYNKNSHNKSKTNKYDNHKMNCNGINDNHQKLGNKSNLSSDNCDLSKLQMMTAVDFSRDRYARFGVHESEIKDSIRTDAYKNCLDYCADNYIEGKVVLVIRCGIGLLPLLCLRTGRAKKVIALEQSACIEYARQIIIDNEYSNEVILIQSSVQDLKELPNELSEVDVIVSDFMGDCVLGQGDQMEQVILARDRFLKPNGLMIPTRVSLYAQLSEQRRAYENQRVRKRKNKKNDNHICQKVDQPMDIDYDSDSSSDSTLCSWWSNVYGFDMRSKTEFIVDSNSENMSVDPEWCVMPEPIFSYFNPNKVVSNSCLIKRFDMHKCTIAEVRCIQTKDLKFKCIAPFGNSQGRDYAHMLELFMEVNFPNGKIPKNDKPSIGFSTCSDSPCTRYKQTGLLLRDQLLINKGDEFTINEFSMWRGPQQNQVNKALDETNSCKNTPKYSLYEESLKLRLRYTFVNKYIKAVDRRCAYTISRYLY